MKDIEDFFCHARRPSDTLPDFIFIEKQNALTLAIEVGRGDLLDYIMKFNGPFQLTNNGGIKAKDDYRRNGKK